MKTILSHVNANLHSASTPGGIVKLNLKTVSQVPDDVIDHPGYWILHKAGLIKEMGDRQPTQAEIDADLGSVGVNLMKSSGIDGDAGDWTQAGRDKAGYPVEKGSPEDVTVPAPVVPIETVAAVPAKPIAGVPKPAPTPAPVVPGVPVAKKE